MSNSILNFLNPFFSRNKSGDYIYDLTAARKWTTGNFSNLEISQKHPILTPALLFISKLFSQAEFYVENTNTGKRVNNHPLITLLNKPNYYQTQPDFLETLSFMQIASGVAVGYVKKSIGFGKPQSIIILDPALIKYPDDFKTGVAVVTDRSSIENTKIVYDPGEEDLEIALKDLLFFYDSPNTLSNKNAFLVESRITGLKQTLINTQDSLIAKNIILKTNGKELVTGPKNDTSFPFGDDEKEGVESKLFGSYGLGVGRKRGIVTKADISWKSLHIALRDLGLDESVKVDGNIIYTALHIPKDIVSLEAKKTTYNNFKESMVSYIQNEMQPTADSTCATLQKLIPESYLKVKATYEHMPIMKFILLEKYDGIKKRGDALSALRNAGLPDEIALEMVGLDKNIKLAEIVKPNTKDNEEGAGSEE